MKKHSFIFGSIAMALFLATSLFAGDVKTNYNRSANFNQYKTYSWGNVQTQEAPLVDRIKSAVDEALAAKGWRQVASGGDVSVTATEITEDQQILNTYDDITTTETYQVGSLVLEMFDTRTAKLIWRGSSSDTLSSKPAKNIKNLDKGVQRMFKNFPPEAKG